MTANLRILCHFILLEIKIVFFTLCGRKEFDKWDSFGGIEGVIFIATPLNG